MNIAIVTDSTADLPQEMIEKYSIRVMHNFIIIDGKEYEDNVDITREEFYERLPQMAKSPTTATASSGSYQDLYEEIFRKGYNHIISIHPPSLLSGIHNAASVAAEAFRGRVHVIDSGSISMGMGLQVLQAAEAAAKGMHVKEILEFLVDVKRRVRLFAMLDTLEFIRRSGRVSWARARIGTLLSVKPFIELRDGKVLSLGQVRTRMKGIRHLIELYGSQGVVEKLAILHTNAESEARNFLEAIGVSTNLPPFLVNVTTIIGTHVGPNALGFTLIKSE